MAIFLPPECLSASTDGLPVQVVATATAGTTIHTADAVGITEVYLWASNVSALPVALTVEWGGAGAANELVSGYLIPANSGLIPIALGVPIKNSKVIKAFAGTTLVINLHGHVNRIV